MTAADRTAAVAHGLEPAQVSCPGLGRRLAASAARGSTAGSDRDVYRKSTGRVTTTWWLWIFLEGKRFRADYHQKSSGKTPYTWLGCPKPAVRDNLLRLGECGSVIETRHTTAPLSSIRFSAREAISRVASTWCASSSWVRVRRRHA